MSLIDEYFNMEPDEVLESIKNFLPTFDEFGVVENRLSELSRKECRMLNRIVRKQRKERRK